MHVSGVKKNISVKEVPANKKSLDSGDVFILDLGLSIYQVNSMLVATSGILSLQWNGKTCNKDEKYKAVQYIQQLKSERSGRCKVETLGTILLTSYLFVTNISCYR